MVLLLCVDLYLHIGRQTEHYREEERFLKNRTFFLSGIYVAIAKKISNMKKRIFIIVASVLMLLVGVLRGIGGFFLLINGNKIDVYPPITATDLVSRLCGIGLIIVLVIFFIASFKLLKNSNPRGWNLAWIGIFIFLFGGLLNGYLLFGNPFVQDQIINFGASILIALNLLIGRKSLIPIK